MNKETIELIKEYTGEFFYHEKKDIYGYVCYIDDKKIVYIRDSMNRWSMDKKSLKESKKIDESLFYAMVKIQAIQAMSYPLPTTKKIKAALMLYSNNIQISIEEIRKILS